MNHGPGDTAPIGKAAAIAAARSGIEAAGLTRDPHYRLALEEGGPDAPLLVERLDRPGSCYYLVPWRTGEGVVALVRVDASDGALLGAVALPSPVPSPFLSPEEALECAAQVVPRGSLGAPRLVWQPCRESTSPLLPFYQIAASEGFAYVDMRGAVFAEPTPLGLGGG